MGNFDLVCDVFNKNGNHLILLVSCNSKIFCLNYVILIQRMRTITPKHSLMSKSRFFNLSPQLALGATERFSVGQKQRPLVNSSVVILQNPVDEERATSVESL